MSIDDLRVLSRTPGKLKQFVLDLHSGKLHREFHHGPDVVQESHQIEAKTEENKPAVDATGELSLTLSPYKNFIIIRQHIFLLITWDYS